MFHRTLALFLISFALGTGAASAQPGFENLDRLDGLVATTVGATIGEQGGATAPIDRRLRLKPCPNLPSVEGPAFGAAIVKCDAMGWRIRVPLRLAPNAQGAMPQVYAAQVARPREVVIRKGDPVRLVAGNEGFTVSRTMISDQDGAIGETIRVRDDAKSPPVMARVENAGIVRVPGI